MEIIFNKKDYNSHKDFYQDIYNKLDGKSMPDWEQYGTLGGTLLDEFLWYCHNDNSHYIFLNFDVEKINQEKSYEDRQYALILRIFDDFIKEFPNNTIEFRNDEEQ